MRKIFTGLLILMLVSVFAVAGCTVSTEEGLETGEGEVGIEKGREPVVTTDKSKLAGETETLLLVKDFNLTIESEDVEKSSEKAKNVAEKYGGYTKVENYSSEPQPGVIMEKSQSSAATVIYEAYLELRVPADKSEKAVQEIKKIGEVKAFNRSVTDVTKPITELKIRLENLKAQAGRLQELYKKAGTVKEVLEIEKELSRVRSEIDINESELKEMESRVTYASIILTIRKPAGLVSPGIEFDWKRLIRIFVEQLVYVLEIVFKLLAYIVPIVLIYIVYRIGKFVWFGFKR